MYTLIRAVFMRTRRSTEKREQAPRTPNASRQRRPNRFQIREAFGARPACRRFRVGAGSTQSVWLVLLGLAVLLATGSALADSTKRPQDFPRPLASYAAMPGAPVWQILVDRVKTEPFNLVATIIFFLAILHTFLASKFTRLAHRFEREHQECLAREAKRLGEGTPREEVSFGAEAFHFLGEIEAIFGIWIVPLLIAMAIDQSWPTARDYIGHGLDFTEPMFVVIIMTIAASRPILKLAEWGLSLIALLGRSSVTAWWFTIVTVGPLLGSLITEPAAMTISALLLSEKFYSRKPSAKLAYATLGLLFVNVSVGGTLTHFAAPPVLMVSGKWNWGLSFMLAHFGWKALVGILIATLVYFALFCRDLTSLEKAQPGTGDRPNASARNEPIPAWVTLVHALFLVWTVITNHYPALFIGGFLFYLAFHQATEHHQTEVSLRPALLVGFFLAGLVVHGGLQGWWISPVLSGLGRTSMFVAAAVLTAFNDNAAITYLASLVPDLSVSLRYAVVAGAVAGGGLTVIANAPNPAGQAILGKFFPEGIAPTYLFIAALLPTLVVAVVFLVF
jgi:hypothetical protein